MGIERYHYVSPRLDRFGELDDAGFALFSERHKVAFRIPALKACEDPLASCLDAGSSGIVIEMLYGWASRKHLRAAARLLRKRVRVFFYWPGETAIECIDLERLRSYRSLWLLVHAVYIGGLARERLRPYGSRARFIARKLIDARTPADSRHLSDGQQGATRPESWKDLALRMEKEAQALASTASPAPLNAIVRSEPGRLRIAGTGVYLRTDFWARIESGGSYGHTCYVAKALADVTDRFMCFMAHRFSLLDELGVTQVIPEPPAKDASERAFLVATDHYYTRLRPAVEAARPTYIYERLCLGNYVGARLARDLAVPYLVEYNGSEISMNRSFGGSGFVYEAAYLQAEEAAFRQATVISVVSSAIRDDLVRRGVAAEKILVNPNGVDIDVYAPPAPEERAQLRTELGFSPGERVIGFIGTFGGWHGIDLLAAAIPRICQRAPEAAFLLIGSGMKKPLIDEVVIRHELGHRVRCVGSVPQKEGARLLRACDIYVSPHNAHMVDSRFFGSPTKVFEYMAMSGAIIASDLEQIGEVLSPAFRAADLPTHELDVTNERSILCTPGNVDEFVEAALYLVKNDRVASRIGKNARHAAAANFTWDRHVAKLLGFAAGFNAGESERAAAPAAASVAAFAGESPESVADADSGAGPRGDGKRVLATGDQYKDEVQNQWNNNPCGSQYVKNASPHTLEWFIEAERYRYDEYAPWMAETMEFDQHGGKALLEIGAGLGTDLAQFARHGAIVTDVDLSLGHLKLAQENFRLRGLHGSFVHHDAETLPFPDNSFDVVYANGVIHHTPNTQQLVGEVYRVLRPGGKVIIMVYAENSLHYWRNIVAGLGLRQGQLFARSVGHIMSCSVEMTENDARPLVKVYSRRALRKRFDRFRGISIVQRQMVSAEVPSFLKWLPLPLLGRLMGWNLILKAYKPR